MTFQCSACRRGETPRILSALLPVLIFIFFPEARAATPIWNVTFSGNEAVQAPSGSVATMISPKQGGLRYMSGIRGSDSVVFDGVAMIIGEADVLPSKATALTWTAWFLSVPVSHEDALVVGYSTTTGDAMQHIHFGIMYNSHTLEVYCVMNGKKYLASAVGANLMFIICTFDASIGKLIAFFADSFPRLSTSRTFDVKDPFIHTGPGATFSIGAPAFKVNRPVPQLFVVAKGTRVFSASVYTEVLYKRHLYYDLCCDAPQTCQDHPMICPGTPATSAPATPAPSRTPATPSPTPAPTSPPATPNPTTPTPSQRTSAPRAWPPIIGWYPPAHVAASPMEQLELPVKVDSSPAKTSTEDTPPEAAPVEAPSGPTSAEGSEQKLEDGDADNLPQQLLLAASLVLVVGCGIFMAVRGWSGPSAKEAQPALFSVGSNAEDEAAASSRCDSTSALPPFVQRPQ
eukprot:Sspe_Gene.47194::Locus_23880_Transcript_2_2_Confidence_0.750_Length_1586::g.47194::m.47194